MKNKEKYNLSELNITIENGSVVVENLNKKFNGLREYCEWLEEDSGTWIPKYGDLYWYINYKEIFNESWTNDEYDRFNLEKRNVYQTKEEAQKALNMYEFCKARSFEPNWENIKEIIYHLWLDHKNKEVYGCLIKATQGFTPFYYPNASAVQEIIDEYSFDDLKKYYGRV